MAQGLRAGPFRGLAPFSGDDRPLLFGRDEACGRLEALIGGDDRSAALVSGEAGTGKTSLLLACALPAASANDQIGLYCDLTEGWLGALRSTLARYRGRPLEPTESAAEAVLEVAEARNAVVLLVLDHIEQLSWLSDTDRRELGQLVARGSESHSVQLLLAVDRAALHVLGQLPLARARIPDERRVQLGRFDRATAARVIEQTILAHGTYMQAGLAELIAEELCADGPTRPADLQRVCQAALLQRATTLKAYTRAGGAQVLATLYVERLAARAGGFDAQRVLAALVEPENPQTALDLGSLASRAGLGEQVAQQKIEGLLREGLIRAVDLGEGRRSYAVLHPLLRPSIRDLVAPLRRGRAQARLALRRRIDAGALLRPHELLHVRRYLGRAISAKQQIAVRRSQRMWTIVLAVLLAIPLLSYAAIYAGLASSSYLSAYSALGGERVVVRAGDPGLRFAFAWAPGSFGQLERDTGIALASLPREQQKRIRDEQIVGDLLDRRKGVPDWLHHLLEAFSPVRHGAWLMLAGHRKAGSKLLLRASARADDRAAAAKLLVLLARDSAATREALLRCTRDSRPTVRLMAVRLVQQLRGRNRRAVLEAAVRDRDPQVRLTALNALAGGGAAVLPLLEQRLLDADDRVQRAALHQLVAAAGKHPKGVLDAILRSQASPHHKRLDPIAAPLDRLRARLLRRKPKLMVKHLARLLAQAKGARRALLLQLLVPLADQLERKEVLALAQRLDGDDDVQVRAAAVGLLARFGESAQTMERLDALAHTYRPRGEAVAMRRAAAVALGLVDGDRDERVKLLKRLLVDRDTSVRSAAAGSLLRAGTPGLIEVRKRMRAGWVDIAHAALHEVCHGSQPDRRVATVVLSVAWDLKRGSLREQALGCAQMLAKASPRLAMWLADQAGVSKDAAVRRAAAPAVALAVERWGRRLARVARHYLGDDDSSVRVAAARALSERLPKSPGFLFRYAERLTRAPEPTVRAAGVELAVRTAGGGASAATLLAKLLADKDARVRRAALAAMKEQYATLRELGGKQRARLGSAVGKLVAKDGGQEAHAALEVASKIGLQAPLRRAAAHREPTVRAAALEALTRGGKPERALKVLEAAQRDSAPALRLAAIRALGAQSGRLGKPAVELLERSTKAAHVAERAAAFEALGRVQDEALPAAIAVLREAASDPSEERRRLAMRALGTIVTGSPPGSRAAPAGPGSQGKAASKAGAERAGSRHEAAAALLDGALDPAHDVRAEARSALASYLGRRCPVKLLWKLLRHSERNAVLRRTALAALAWHGRTRGAGDLKGLSRQAKQLPVVTSSALRLAVALASSDASPERVLTKLYGW